MTMRLSEEIKSKIRAEYEGWFESQYGDLSTERRKELKSSFEIKRLPEQSGSLFLLTYQRIRESVPDATKTALNLD